MEKKNLFGLSHVKRWTMKIINRNEVDALIRLLDDTDAEIYNQIQDRLVHYGKDVIPLLETAWSSSMDAIMQEESIQKLLDKLRKDAWLEMNDGLTALEQVKVLNKIFFDIHGFAGNTQNYHAPQNSLLNIVLETRKGNPLMLSILYLEIARSAGIPVYGVNLPEHFILCYKDELEDPASIDDHSNILFYLNPFSKGDIFNKKEIDTFLQQLKIEKEKSFYEPCTNKDMIQRLIRNLMNSYHKLGFMEKVEELMQMMRATQ